MLQHHVLPAAAALLTFQCCAQPRSPGMKKAEQQHLM
jgi:hypothetical protein